VTLAAGAHFHVRYGHMHMNEQCWFRRPRWEERWKDTRYDVDDGRTPEVEWERQLATARHHHHAVVVLPPEQLGPDDLYIGRFVPESPGSGDEHVRIYRCSGTGCPEQRQGGF